MQVLVPPEVRSRQAARFKPGPAAPAASTAPKLRDRLREQIRLEGKSPNTAAVYWHWTKGYIRFHGLQTTYSGIASAWKRAKARAGVADAHIHDIRAKALTDKERSEGMQAARTMGTHSTEGQTADYLRSRSAKRTGATR